MNKSRLTIISILFAVPAAIAIAATSQSPQPTMISSGSALQVVCVPSETAQDSCSQSIGIASDRSFIWLGKAVQSGVEITKSDWAITDTLQFPPIPEGHEFSDVMCRYKEKFDQSIVAVVKTSPSEWRPADAWAYRADPVTGKFEQLNAVDVDCYSEQ